MKDMAVRIRLLCAASVLLLTACGDNRPDLLKQIKMVGEMVVITGNSATTYYETRDGHAGVEHDMVRDFAGHLGVQVRFIVNDEVSKTLGELEQGRAHMAAAGLTRTPSREDRFLFGPTYQVVSQQVVCRRGGKRPASVEDLIQLNLAVISDSSYEERLFELKKQYPALKWQSVSNAGSDELLEKVSQKEIDCTIADSNIVMVNQRYFPELVVRFDISESQHLAWIMPEGDDSLQEAMEEWFEQYQDSGQLEKLMEQYYGYIDKFDYVDTRAFSRKIDQRLPKYQKVFLTASKHYKLDWLLLAAQAYQESHWNPHARSPTGVRGMMMLTKVTAEELNVKNRLDAAQSIWGGARYLNQLRNRIPETVTEPERTWMALAAYNVGMGHMWDARQLARQLGKDPDSWQDMREVLPLLSQKKYYRNLKHGYARGWEPVRYVQQIRDYHDILEKRLTSDVVSAH